MCDTEISNKINIHLRGFLVAFPRANLEILSFEHKQKNKKLKMHSSPEDTSNLKWQDKPRSIYISGKFSFEVIF